LYLLLLVLLFHLLLLLLLLLVSLLCNKQVKQHVKLMMQAGHRSKRLQGHPLKLLLLMMMTLLLLFCS
jgi:hypothetical protein